VSPFTLENVCPDRIREPASGLSGLAFHQAALARHRLYLIVELSKQINGFVVLAKYVVARIIRAANRQIRPEVGSSKSLKIHSWY